MSDAARALISEGEACLKRGDHNGAALAWCRALDLDPRLAGVHNNLGALFLMAGMPDVALTCFLNATDLRGEQGGFRIGLARALVELGQRDRAAAYLAQSCQRLPADAALADAARQVVAAPGQLSRFDGLRDRAGQVEAADRLAELGPAATTGDPDARLAALMALIWALPDRPGLWRALADAALACDQPLQAEFHARRALALDPDDSEAWLMLARILGQAAARADDVGRVLERAVALCGPRLVLVEALCGRLIARGEAEAAHDRLRALRAEVPGSDGADWLRLEAGVLEAAGQRDQAAAVFTGALAGARNPQAVLLAAAAFHERDLEPGAWLSLYTQAEGAGADLDHPDLHHARARALFRAGETDAAATAIAAALAGDLSDEARRGAAFMAGQIADRRGDHAAAWQAFETGNRLLEAGWEATGRCDPAVPLARLDSLRRRLEAEIAAGSTHVKTPDPASLDAATARALGADLAFLVGFPRSGTTLLDSVLRSHSAIAVVEERPVMIEALRAVVPGMTGDETRFSEAWLDGVDAADVGQLRAAYRDRLAHHAGPDAASAGVTQIDKLPLNMNWAPVLHRIFPAAAFILARRHPLDVAVSNFAQDYAPNNAMMVMTRLDRIARFHAASFDLWDRFVDHRQPRWAEVRYEALVEDPQAAIAPVMALLGREWEASQARFFETARARGRIATPSAHQVIQPLYTGSRERWRHYARFLSGPACEPLRARAQVWGLSTETGADAE